MTTNRDGKITDRFGPGFFLYLSAFAVALLFMAVLFAGVWIGSKAKNPTLIPAAQPSVAADPDRRRRLRDHSSRDRIDQCCASVHTRNTSGVLYPVEPAIGQLRKRNKKRKI